MDKISREVVEETQSVLRELRGYIAVVQKNQGDSAHPVLALLSAKLDQTVCDIEDLDRSGQHSPTS
ncbi:hypothetical protein [Roseobacter fucihabitans]|uniref:hypothetical protein n=1 Tax=Roseobacter fucihabitans TaxID=1537242 RepID=UPI0030CC02C1